MFRFLSVHIRCVIQVIPNFQIIFDPDIVFSSPLKQCYKGLLNLQVSLQGLSVPQPEVTLLILTLSVNSLTWAGGNIPEHLSQILAFLLPSCVCGPWQLLNLLMPFID